MLSELSNLNTSRALIIGDLMLDEYWIGNTNRISPEAPVPIVLVKDTSYRAGGAANVALNMAGVSNDNSKVDLLGILGKDYSGKKISKILKNNKKINFFSVITSNYPTINKLRIISNNQQLFRIDREKFYCNDSFNKLLTTFNEIVNKNNYNIIVLSDYNKGTLANPQLFIQAAIKKNIPILVDPKNNNYLIYKDATLLTPNIKEFAQMVDLHKNSVDNADYNYSEIVEKGHNLIEQLNLHAVVITQGKKGLTLLTKDRKDQHFDSYTKEVFDVTGAGDTVIATLAAALASGINLHKAAYLATIAAGIIVSKMGTCAVSKEELLLELKQIEQHDLIKNNMNFGIIDPEKLATIVQTRKLLGEKIVFVNGCFDVLHAGHIEYLEKAKSLGDYLIVAVNDDASIKTLKGDKRPINNLIDRMKILSSINAVNWVVSFGSGEIRPGNLIKKINPNILVKSKDAFATIEEIPEYEGASYVLSQGGEVCLLERPLTNECNVSSSKIIEKIQNLTTI